MENKKRTRVFATVVYPESAPENWLDKLREQCIPALISPLHNQDLNEDNSIKKEHFHIMVLFSGVKTAEQAKEVFDEIGGIGCEAIKCTRAYARYLCHLDSDKVKYDINDVISIGGVDYQYIIGMPSDKYSAIGEMIDFININDIQSYASLLVYSKENRNDWFRVLCDNGTMTIFQFLRSRTWEVEKAKNYKEFHHEKRDSNMEKK